MTLKILLFSKALRVWSDILFTLQPSCHINFHFHLSHCSSFTFVNIFNQRCLVRPLTSAWNCFSLISIILFCISLLILTYSRFHVCSNVSCLGIFFWVLYSWSDFIAKLFLKTYPFPFKTFISVCNYLCNHLKSFCVTTCIIILKFSFFCFPWRFQIPWE